MANKWHGAHSKTICASMMRAVVRFDNIQEFAQKCDRLRANSPRAELEVAMYVLKHCQYVGDLTESGALVRSAPGRLRSARRRQRSRRLRLWSLHGGAAQPFHSAVRSRRSTVSIHHETVPFRCAIAARPFHSSMRPFEPPSATASSRRAARPESRRRRG
jgi:hypothetical protein